jgi:hypothetical protein
VFLEETPPSLISIVMFYDWKTPLPDRCGTMFLSVKFCVCQERRPREEGHPTSNCARMRTADH